MKLLNFIKNRILKLILTIVGIVILFAIIVILFISPIAKYLINNRSEKWLGRQVNVGWIYVNPFTGYMHIKNLKIYEKNTDSLFITASGLSASFATHKLLHKTIEFSSISLNNPEVWFIQDKKSFNFDDMMQKFSSKDSTDTTTKEPKHFNILNIGIYDGIFHYIEKSIPVNYYIKNVNIESSGKWWNTDTMDSKFSFSSGPSTGDVKGKLVLQFSDLNYHLDIDVKQFDLKIIEQYLHQLASYGSFAALLDADLSASGNFKDPQAVNSKGHIILNDFHFGRTTGDDFVSFNRLAIYIGKLNPENYIYHYDSVILTNPYFKYERYDSLDNLQRMFGQGAQGIKEGTAERKEKFNIILELADYISKLSKNFFKSKYVVGKISINNGTLEFNDYSLTEKFSIAAKPFYIEADAMDKANKHVNIYFKTDISAYGNMAASLALNPNDTSEFDLNFYINKVSLAMFNPYLIQYTSYPLDRGTLELNGKWKVKNGVIQSKNHLLLLDAHQTKQLSVTDANKLPVPLVLAFIREPDNKIDYEIPVKGNLKKPKIKLWDVIYDLLSNILIKPASIPYMAHVDHFQSQLEKFLNISWLTHEHKFNSTQEKFLMKIKDYLKDNPNSFLEITPIEFEQLEKEYILFFEAKKKYFLYAHHYNMNEISTEDSIKVDKMSMKDGGFNKIMKKSIKDTVFFTKQDLCRAYLGFGEGKDLTTAMNDGDKIVDIQFNKLCKARKETFESYFNEPEILKRIKIKNQEYKIPYNGFSYYQIGYKGELPKNLIDAYNKMYEINQTKKGHKKLF